MLLLGQHKRWIQKGNDKNLSFKNNEQSSSRSSREISDPTCLDFKALMSGEIIGGWRDHCSMTKNIVMAPVSCCVGGQVRTVGGSNFGLLHCCNNNKWR